MVGMSVQGMTGFLTASGDPGRTAGQHVVKSGRTKTRGCIRGGGGRDPTKGDGQP